MQDVRCTCHKIVAQIDGDTIIIKCRHCKRVVLIKTAGINSIACLDFPRDLQLPVEKSTQPLPLATR